MPAILEGNKITKRFSGLVALKEVDFDLREGEILGLIGPNGAGKTTLFNIISGFFLPDEGSVSYKGKELTGLKPFNICKLGIARTFQVVKPFLNMKVLDNVIVGSLSRTKDMKEAKDIALEKLRFVGMEDKKDLLASSLTLADRKRLEMARALATMPEVLLLDEAIAGLNPKETEEAVELISKIREEGITIFMIEHVMRAIMTISDRIIVLHHGEKIAEGSPREIASDQRVVDAYLGEKYVF
ncbi:MAG: ABC transporter ATP-binding protein [Candidatus Bathyarchaeia archaeon]